MPLNRTVRNARQFSTPDILWDFTKGKYVGAHPYDCLTATQTTANFVTNSAGLLVPVPVNTLRISDLGLLAEVARTNVVLQSRDMSNASWTKTTMTAAKDQTGSDGTANGASSLLATAGNATCLQSITLGSSARFQSAYVKRLVGSGTVNMTMDGGTTWVDITSQINSTTWSRVFIPTQTIANPNVGFRLVTNADKIAVDLVQNENGTSLTSAIPTTTVASSRSADVIAISNRLLKLLSTFTFSYFTAGTGSPSKTAGAYLLDFDNDNNNDPLELQSGTPTRIMAFATGNVNATIGGGGTLDLPVRGAVGSSPSGVSVVGNYGTVVVASNVFNAITNPCLGSTTSANQQYGGYITKVAAYSRKLSDPQLALLTLTGQL